MELCDNLEKAKQKISHDLQVKESQVNIQSGQLNSCKKDIEKLEQELKRWGLAVCLYHIYNDYFVIFLLMPHICPYRSK